MLYVTGDTHGDYERFTSSALKKLKKGDTLFICGDFGFIWDGSKNEEKMLKKIGKLKYNVCFIDGTHENFELLRSYEVSEFKGGKVHHITGNLYHLMRGQVYDFDGVSVFAMGGGESPDIDIRSDLNSWSGDEIPTEAELTEGANNLKRLGNKVDIICTQLTAFSESNRIWINCSRRICWYLVCINHLDDFAFRVYFVVFFIADTNVLVNDILAVEPQPAIFVDY